jgi:filamin/ABP280 repeat
MVTYSGEHINESPFSCFVFDANRVKLEGKNVLTAGVEALFIADAREGGPGRLTAELESLNGEVFPAKVESKENNVHFITVIPPIPGRYRLKVLLNKLHVNGSPLLLTVNSIEDHFGNEKFARPTPSPRFVVQESEITRHKVYNNSSSYNVS